MKNGSCALLLLFLLSAAAFPADYSILQTVFIPPRYYVGDHVELRLRIRVSSDTRISVPETMPEASWITFRDIGIIDRGDDKELRILFTPFYPGTQTLPMLKFGDVTLNGIKINTDSILSGIREEYRPPLGQVLLPGTRLYFALLALGSVGVAALAVFLIGFGRERLKRLRESWDGGMPYRRMRKVMRKLNRDLEKIDDRRFYIVLLDELRVYISGKIHDDCRSATTQELGRRLDCRFPHVPAGLREDLLSLFRRGDLVKFSHARVAPDERKTALERLRSLLAELEKTRPEKERIDVDA